MTPPITSLHVRLLAGRFNTGNREIELAGRLAWTLNELILAGPRGCTPISTPAPRWSSYVHRLRGIGLNIETRNTPHGGAFAGMHARYILCSAVEVLSADLEAA